MKAFDYKKFTPRKINPHNPYQEWLKKDYPGFLHTIFMQGIQAGVFEMNKLYPFGFKSSYSFNSSDRLGNMKFIFFWDLRDLARVRKIFIGKAKKDLSFFNRIYKKWLTDSRANFKVYQAAEKIDFSLLADKHLYQWYQKLYFANLKQARTGYLTDAFLTVGQTDWLSDFIKSRLPQKYNLIQTIEVLTSPAIPTYVNEEFLALSKIAKSLNGHWPSFSSFERYVKNNKKLSLALQIHAAKFYWLENNYFTKVLTWRDFAKKLFDNFIKNEASDLKKVLKNNYINKHKLLRKINDAWLENVIVISEKMTHMQDYRKCSLIRFSHFLNLIFKEMAKRSNLRPVDYYNLIFPEIKEVFLQKKIDREKISSRIKENFIYGSPSGYLIYEGNDLKKFVNKKDFFPVSLASAEIRGVPACSGLATGRVKIIKDAHQVLKLGKDSILVTNNTTPEFVPLMKQAAAIITEQGGITTHAAIISRELGIPCIIGVGNATQVLKDGDLVEVDAFKGIIKKIIYPRKGKK